MLMQLLVIRHAIAEDRDQWAQHGHPDAERPLTDRGRRRMRRAAAGLRTVVPQVDVLAASPLARAVETAELVAREYDAEVQQVPQLAPEHPVDDLLPWLRRFDPGAVVAVVGHEPHLGFLVGWLLTARHESFVELKKGAACLLEFDDPPAPGDATLRWALAPSQLRALRGA
jgi:phosphohistidine phosphatase